MCNCRSCLAGKKCFRRLGQKPDKEDDTTIEIEVLFTGTYIPGKPRSYDWSRNKSIEPTMPSVADFKIYKYVGHNWQDITHIFNADEIEQRKAEYLDQLEDERENAQEVG